LEFIRPRNFSLTIACKECKSIKELLVLVLPPELLVLLAQGSLGVTHVHGMFDILNEVLVIVYIGTLFRKLPSTGRTVEHAGGDCHVGPTAMWDILLEQVVEVSSDFAGLYAGKIDRVRTDKNISIAFIIRTLSNQGSIVPSVTRG
jgi:hypothetical protein